MVLTWNSIPSVATDTIRLDNLRISFVRTVKVPDGDGTTALPPDLSNFPLYEVRNHVNRLTEHIAVKEAYSCQCTVRYFYNFLENI
jgi:hypothetical protein